jgi:hypothetical protein
MSGKTLIYMAAPFRRGAARALALPGAHGAVGLDTLNAGSAY